MVYVPQSSTFFKIKEAGLIEHIAVLRIVNLDKTRS